MNMKCMEYVARTMPFAVRRIVKWGDCDPAGVVYTATFADYVIAAAEAFYAHLLGEGSQHAKDRHGFGTPSRALTFDFRRSLRPDDEFEIEVRVGEIRSRSYELMMRGIDLQGKDLFIACLTPICVARGERRGIEIPGVFRRALQAYRDQCGQPPA